LGTRDFRVKEVTAEYVDITFCYATSFEGTVTIPDSNPLFRSAELTQRDSDCTLRLYLKNKGSFYGWDSYYNENDQLCFKFLNPVKAKAADNVYGADLTGIKIQLDVGHGGLDGGSPAVNPNGTNVDEAELNLKLAQVLQKELESMGATVVLNRTDDSELNVDERIQSLKEAWPDICIAIHQNAFSGGESVNGVQVCYFTPYSQPLASLCYDKTVEAGIYQKHQQISHIYFVGRQTNCPVVLMENGYMTNPKDLAGMQDEAVLQKKAAAMAKAVAEYFLYAVK
jgi:N-acetylmuramoyl-L-alanine amidase